MQVIQSWILNCLFAFFFFHEAVNKIISVLNIGNFKCDLIGIEPLLEPVSNDHSSNLKFLVFPY